MKIKSVQQGAVTIISLQGNLMGGPDATSLNSQIHELLGARKKNLILDLGGVKFMNSSGLGMLIGGASALKNAGGRLVLACASEKILSLIKVTKLSSVFDHYDSVKLATESFKK